MNSQGVGLQGCSSRQAVRHGQFGALKQNARLSFGTVGKSPFPRRKRRFVAPQSQLAENGTATALTATPTFDNDNGILSGSHHVSATNEVSVGVCNSNGVEEGTAATTSTAITSSLPQLWPVLAERHGDALALKDPHASPPTEYSFSQLSQEIQRFANGLHQLGVSHGDKIALFAENSARWLVADQGVMSCGAADAVRGVSSTAEELEYIAVHSESKGLILQDDAALHKMLPFLQQQQQPDNKDNGDDSNARPHSPLRTAISFVVLLWGDEAPSKDILDSLPCPVLTFNDVLTLGDQAMHAPGASTVNRMENNISADDLATLVYTSGTTGRPKGVMLTHANLLYQVGAFPAFLEVSPGQRTLSLLPPWHVYERTSSYYILASGAAQVITNIRRFKEDLIRFPPDHFVCVPLVLDTLHSRVLATLKKASAFRRTLALGLLSLTTTHLHAQRILQGVDLRYAHQPPSFLEMVKAWVLSKVLAPLRWLFQRVVATKIRQALGIRNTVVSGGGSLAAHLDDFYEAIGLPVINGYGLTETSPVLACRSNIPISTNTAASTTSTTATGNNGNNVRGSVGRPTPGTQLRIVDPTTYQDLTLENKNNSTAHQQQGLILARGPGVTKGYYNDPAATAAAFPIGDDGWLDTGDLGWIAPEGVRGSNMAGCLVLTGRSKDTIVLSSGENVEPQPIEDSLCSAAVVKFAILIGQGHRSLGALLVPDEESMDAIAQARGVDKLTPKERVEFLRAAVVQAGVGRPAWEHVHHFAELQRPFSFEDGTLTRTMKPRRAEIMKVYSKEVAELEIKLR